MSVPNEAYDSASQNPTVEDIRKQFCITPLPVPESPLPEGYIENGVALYSKRDQLLARHVLLCDAARRTMAKKNEDYATNEDVFRNFRAFGGLGILVRISDKLARLRTFEERDMFSVSDESLRDTIEDLINYAVIYLAYKQEGK